MSATRRGANNPISARLRRREDAPRSEAKGTQEDQEAEDTQAPEAAALADLEASSLKKLKKPELVEKAASLGLSVGGTKVELIARISEAVQ
jgi:SAP domain